MFADWLDVIISAGSFVLAAFLARRELREIDISGIKKYVRIFAIGFLAALVSWGLFQLGRWSIESTIVPQIIEVEVTRPVEVTKLVENEIISVVETEVTKVVEVTVPVTVEVTSDTPTLEQEIIVATPTATPTQEPAASQVIFSDDFSTPVPDRYPNHPSLNYVNGKLSVTVNRQESYWMSIADVQVERNFYIQAQITYVAGHDCFANMGLGLGDAGGNHHRYMIVGNSSCGPDGAAFYQNGTELFKNSIGNLISKGTTYVVRLEVMDGIHTFYIDGDSAATSFQIEPYGGDVGVFLWRSGDGFFPAEATFHVDNVEVGILNGSN